MIGGGKKISFSEIQPNFVFELLTCTMSIFFLPCPLEPLEGVKIIKFQLQSQFQRFFNQILLVFSQMKDIRHIRWYFQPVAWVMPYWWDLGVLGRWG